MSVRAGGDWLRVDIDTARRLIAAVTLLAAVVVTGLHAPGHVSMDTSIQLYEAHTGVSVSWNPPFMSALMRWLGGGELATTGIVVANVILLYGATLVVADRLLRARAARGETAVDIWIPLVGCVVVLNPMVALYAGIVWKDVLFGALLTAGTACAICFLLARGWSRSIYVVITVLTLAAALLTRQQGIFMAPLLLLLLLAGSPRRGLGWKFGVLVLAFALLVAALQQRVAHAVRDSGARAVSVGFRSIMIFDMMGILARSNRPAGALPVQITPEQLAAVRRVYRPSRIDYIAGDALAEGWVDRFSPATLRAAWWALVMQDPGAYVAHRAAAFATLLGLRGIQHTLPIHVGVDGNRAYLHAVGLEERRGPRDQLVCRIAARFFGWPLYRHAFWLAALAACAVVWLRRPLPPALWRAAGGIIAACGLFYASFVPTMISSDFRYLFGAIPMIGLLVLVLAFSPRYEEVPA